MPASTSSPVATPESIEVKIHSIEAQIKASQQTLGALRAQCRELDTIKAEAARLEASQAGMVNGMVRAVELVTGEASGARFQRAEDFGPYAADFAMGSMMGKLAGFARAGELMGALGKL